MKETVRRIEINGKPSIGRLPKFEAEIFFDELLSRIIEAIRKSDGKTEE